MQDVDLDRYLSTLPGFDRLSEFDRRAVAKACQVQRFEPGEVLLRQGDKGTGAHLLIEGRVRCTLVREGKEEYLSTFEPGELVGVFAMVDHRPRSATCVADGAVTTAFISATVFETLAHRHAAVAYPFQRALGRQLAQDFRRVAGVVQDAIATLAYDTVD